MTRFALLFAGALLLSPATAWATTLGYELVEGAASGPPYPTNPISFDVLHAPAVGHPPDPVHILNITMFSALDAPPPDDNQPIAMVIEGLGGADGAGNVSGTTPDDTIPDGAFFDLFIEAADHPAGADSVMGISPCIMPGDGFFDVGFDVLLDEAGNTAASHLMRFSAENGMRLVEPEMVPNAGHGIHVQFRTEGEGSGFDIGITGHFIVPEPATATLGLLAIGGLLLGRRCV